MADIYKLKVYHGSSNDFSSATYLQDTFVTLLPENENVTDLPTSGNQTVITSNGSHGALYDLFLNDGIFDWCLPFVYVSTLMAEGTIEKIAQYYNKVYAMAIDLKDVYSTDNVTRYVFFTTDNSDYVARMGYQFYIYNNLIYYNSHNVELVSKQSSSVISSFSPIGFPSKYYNSDTNFTSIVYNNLTYKANGSRGILYFYNRSGIDISTFTGYPKTNSDYFYYPLLSKDTPYIEQTDPYAPAGDSTTGGGDGTFDGSSDPVPVPNLPSAGAQDSGFITLFTPTASQMKDLAHYMWVNPLFDIDTGFKKLFSDPMDCILGLSVVPVTIPTSGAKNVNIGNLVTSVTMNVASQQYIEVDCGAVTMDRFFGSYLDFEPYTKIAIFLPYCGTHALSMDDIAGKTIGVVYHIDILTGSCIAFVKCGDSVLYEFNGACGSNIPVNSLNFASTIENAIRIAVNIGTTVATAGASAPATTATELARQKAMNTARNISLAGSTAEGALSLKPSVSRSGALGGGVGILGHQIPYFIITRPRLCKPAKQDFFQGYPSFIQTTIGDLIGKGFTSFTNVIISGQYLTDEEETELENILESGVYL